MIDLQQKAFCKRKYVSWCFFLITMCNRLFKIEGLSVGSIMHLPRIVDTNLYYHRDKNFETKILWNKFTWGLYCRISCHSLIQILFGGDCILHQNEISTKYETGSISYIEADVSTLRLSKNTTYCTINWLHIHLDIFSSRVTSRLSRTDK